jgi:hypothetical protein
MTENRIEFLGNTYSEQEFLKAYMDQKSAENDAKEMRIKMEQALLERYGDLIDDDKTSKQFKVGRFTVGIKRSIRYKLTDAGWDLVWGMPEKDRPVKYEYSHTLGKNIPAIALEEVQVETKPSFEVVYK